MKLSELDEFDGAKYLKSAETICQYLSEAFATGDPRLMVAALRNVVQAAGAPLVAERADVELAVLEQALNDDGVAGLEVVVEFLKMLGLRLQVIPQRRE